MRNTVYRPLALVVALIAAVASASTQAGRPITITEEFENSNLGGWTFGNPAIEGLEPDGGNPGAFFRNRFLDTFAAQPRTTPRLRSPFIHDYRAKNVTFVGIDLAVFDADFSTQGRPLSVILFDDGDTPNDATDDCSVYHVGGHPTPMPNGNWQRYRFRVPSQSEVLPRGWAVQGCFGRTPDEAWNRVITGVDQLRFFTGDPERFFIFQVWDVGIDNPTIIFEPGEPIFDPIE